MKNGKIVAEMGEGATQEMILNKSGSIAGEKQMEKVRQLFKRKR